MPPFVVTYYNLSENLKLLCRCYAPFFRQRYSSMSHMRLCVPPLAFADQKYRFIDSARTPYSMSSTGEEILRNPSCGYANERLPPRGLLMFVLLLLTTIIGKVWSFGKLNQWNI